MPDYGITPDGFNRKRLDAILEDKNTITREALGDDINLSPQSPDGQINGNLAESDANLWELGEKAYDALDPQKATGDQLSALVEFNFLKRIEATASFTTLDVTGVALSVIPAGALVSTDDGTQFETSNEVTLSGGVDQVPATAVEEGAIIAVANSITNIDTPHPGWDTVNNPTSATVGTNLETDSELRIRRAKSISLNAVGTVDAISAKVRLVENLDDAVIYENDESFVIDGIPANSIWVVASGGGTDQDIATAIWDKKSAGCGTFGTVSYPVLDSQGISHDISYSPAVAVPIYLTVNLTAFGDFPLDGVEQIQQAILDFAEENLNIGDEVVYSRLYTPINSVPGHQVDSLFIGISASPSGTSNIPIDLDEESTWDEIRIIVNV